MINETRFSDLAKVELHCHLDGSLSLPCIRQLASMAELAVPETDEELAKLVSVSRECQDLNDYLKTFDWIRPLLQSKEALRLAAYDVVEQAALDGVIYIEVRFAPELSMDKGLSVSDVILAVCQGLEEARQTFGVLAKAVICGLKQTDLKKTTAIFQESVHLNHKDVAGFDMAGNEEDFPTELFKELLSDEFIKGSPITFHAGECGCSANIYQAITLGARRIGHATAIKQSQELAKSLKEKGVLVELCLTSNLQTKAAASLEDFPYPILRQVGTPLSINTDNRTVSQTNLNREYALFHHHFKTSKEEFYCYNRMAIQASFASKEEKKVLLERLKNDYYGENEEKSFAEDFI